MGSILGKKNGYKYAGKYKCGKTACVCLVFKTEMLYSHTSLSRVQTSPHTTLSCAVEYKYLQ